MGEMKKPGPVDYIRDGNLKLSVWVNESENGPFPSITLERTYTDKEGNPQSSHSFSGRELLALQNLLGKGYTRLNRIKRELKIREDEDE